MAAPRATRAPSGWLERRRRMAQKQVEAAGTHRGRGGGKEREGLLPAARDGLLVLAEGGSEQSNARVAAALKGDCKSHASTEQTEGVPERVRGSEGSVHDGFWSSCVWFCCTTGTPSSREVRP